MYLHINCFQVYVEKTAVVFFTILPHAKATACRTLSFDQERGLPQHPDKQDNLLTNPEDNDLWDSSPVKWWFNIKLIATEFSFNAITP